MKNLTEFPFPPTSQLIDELEERRLCANKQNEISSKLKLKSRRTVKCSVQYFGRAQLTPKNKMNIVYYLMKRLAVRLHNRSALLTFIIIF